MRPREKALRFGSEALSDAELLALFLRIGARGFPVIEMASKLLSDYGGWANLVAAPPFELRQNYHGLGEVKVLEITALSELARRILNDERMLILNFDEASKLAAQKIGKNTTEHYLVLLLNARHELVYLSKLYIGTSTNLVLEPRAVVGLALRHGANYLYCFHNHPSGSLTPSEADRRVAREITALANLFEINVLAHGIVIASGRSSEILL